MIVLAESNFVLELALQQEERDEVERLVAMAEARRIELVVPACALFEPYETLIRRKKAGPSPWCSFARSSTNSPDPRPLLIWLQGRNPSRMHSRRVPTLNQRGSRIQSAAC
jgi:hypothetical protein